MEMRALTVQERALKAQAYKKVGQLIKEGKLDEARAYRDSFNAVMDEQGFTPLKYPPNVGKMLGDYAATPKSFALTTNPIHRSLTP